MCFAGRVSQDFIDPTDVAELEPACGQACLEAVIQHSIVVSLSFPNVQCCPLLMTLAPMI